MPWAVAESASVPLRCARARCSVQHMLLHGDPGYVGYRCVASGARRHCAPCFYGARGEHREMRSRARDTRTCRRTYADGGVSGGSGDHEHVGKSHKHLPSPYHCHTVVTRLVFDVSIPGGSCMIGLTNWRFQDRCWYVVEAPGWVLSLPAGSLRPLPGGSCMAKHSWRPLHPPQILQTPHKYVQTFSYRILSQNACGVRPSPAPLQCQHSDEAAPAVIRHLSSRWQRVRCVCLVATSLP